MFEGFANWFQGNGWISNAQLDEKKRKETQAAALAQARASVPNAIYDPNTNKFTNKAQIAEANQSVKALEMPNIVNQFSPQQLKAHNDNPNAPWSQRLQIAAKQQQLLEPFKERQKTGIEKTATVLGNIPVANVFGRLGAWGVEGWGNLIGDKSLAEAGSNFRSNLDLGMSNDEIAALPQERQDKLRALQTGVELASPLDLIGITGLVKAPIVTGIKQGAKEIVTGGLKTGLTAETKSLLRQGAKQQGTGALIGGGIGAVADPAIQAYINDGEIDWGQVPGSVATGMLWGAGIPNVVGPTRNTARNSVGNAVNDVSSSAEQVGALTLAKQRLFRTAAQIEEQAESAPVSELGKIDDGISSPTQAAAKRQEAKSAADTLRQQAGQIPDEAPKVRQVTTQNLSTPETNLVLQKATPEQLLARDAEGDVNATAEIQRRFDEAQAAVDADTVAPAPEAPVANTDPLNTVLESPTTQASREIADATPPVAPVNNADTLNLDGLPPQSRQHWEGVSERFKTLSPEDKARWQAQVDQEKRMAELASETISGDEFDHPMGYENPTPEMLNNLKPEYRDKYRITPDGITVVDAAQARQITDEVIAQIKKAQSRLEVDRLYDEAQGKLSELDIDDVIKKELADAQVFKRQELVDMGIEPSGVDPTRPQEVPTETAAEQAARGQAEFERRAKTVGLTLDENGNLVPSKKNTPTIKSFGREIELSEANGYEPSKAADGGTLYSKLAKVGSNRKGDRGFERRYYDSKGNKITKEQFEAMTDGRLSSGGRAANVAAQASGTPSIDRLKQLGLIDESGNSTVGAMNQKTGQWAKLSPEQLQSLVDETGNIKQFSADDPLHITRISGLENPRLNKTKTETTISDMANSSPALREALPDTQSAPTGSQQGGVKPQPNVSTTTAETSGYVMDDAGVVVSEGDLIDTIERLSKIPQNERTAKEATEISMARKLLKDGKRVDAPTGPQQDPQAQQLGTIAQKAIIDGDDLSTLNTRIETAAMARADAEGLNWEKIARQVDIANRKMQANKGVKKTFDYDADVKLTKAEESLYRDVLEEMNTLRNRVDPKLLGDGNQPFYVPRQLADEEFNPSLVNEIRRSKSGGLETDEVDYTFKPINEYIKRYSDAPTAMTDNFVESIENVVTKNGDVKPTGVKVSEQTRRKLQKGSEDYIAKQDDVARALARGDDVEADRLIKEADKSFDNTFKDVFKDIHNSPGNSRKAVENLKSTRMPYIQSSIRSNMFTNVVNRLWDQAQKGIVQGGDRAFLRGRLQKAQAKSGDVTFATSKPDWKLANDLAKGSLSSRLGRDFKTSVRLETASAKTPLGKALKFVDSVYRAGSTAWTGAGDLVHNATRLTNAAMIQKARNAGITDAGKIRDYVIKSRNTPEYKNLLADMENQYAGYVSLPRYRTAAEQGDHRYIQALSKLDNSIKSAITSRGGNARLASELNDLILPPTTGFAAATARVGAKGANAMALGIPGFRSGLKMLQSGAPNAQAIGTLKMARSIIDGVGAGGVYAGGLYLGLNGNWTGSYPSDPNEAARWEQQGITPNTLRIPLPDGQTLQIEPGRVLGVLGLPLVIPTVIGNAIREGVDPIDALGQAVDGTLGQFINNFGVDALSDSIVDLTNLVKGSDFEKERAQRNLMNRLGFTLANSVTPAAGIQNNVANVLDENKRDTSGSVVDTVLSRNPFTRQGVDVRLDSQGNPVRNNARLGGSQSITVANDRPEESSSATDMQKEISRLAQLGFEVTPSKRNTNAADNGTANSIASTLLSDPLYTSLSDEEKGETMKELLAGTKTKGINNDLDDTSKLALAKYSLLGSDKGDAWKSDSIENFANYSLAKYENEVLNGTIDKASTENDDQTIGSLRYNALVGQVLTQLGTSNDDWNAYQSISKTKFNAMAPDNPTRKALEALDRQLVGAGLPSKFQNSKGGYGSGSGSGGGRSFPVASSSVSKAAKSSFSQPKGLKPSFNTSLVKPLGIGEASESVKRKITVKRGVQL